MCASRTGTVLTIAVLVLAGIGCERTGQGADAGTTESGAASAEPAAAPGHACDLLTAEEVGRIAGQPVEARPGEEGPAVSKCEYWGTTSEVPYLGLTVYWSGGREQWDIQAAAYGMAGDLMRASEGVDLDSIVEPGPVPGLGDAAVYAELLPTLVLKDDVLLEMYLFYLPEARSHVRTLAGTILERVADGR